MAQKVEIVTVNPKQKTTAPTSTPKSGAYCDTKRLTSAMTPRGNGARPKKAY